MNITTTVTTPPTLRGNATMRAQLFHMLLQHCSFRHVSSRDHAGLQAPPTLSLPPHATKSAAPAAPTQPAAPPAMTMMGGMSSGQSVQHMAFEEFASTLQAPATLRAAQVRRHGRRGPYRKSCTHRNHAMY
jgi:hypothetical protein